MGSRRISFTACFACLIYVSCINAADWYYRPKLGGPYGTGDGTSYNNAWHLQEELTWGPDGIKAGDTLYVCGYHDSGYQDRGIAVGAAGTPTAPIVIDGECPKVAGATDPQDFDPGTLFPSGYRITNGWDGPDIDGIYTHIGGCTYDQVIEDGTLRLNRIARHAVDPNVPDILFSQWPAGSFFQAANACAEDRLLFYKPSSGVASDHIINTSAGASGVSIVGYDDIHVRNLSILNASTAGGGIGVSDANRVRIENNEIYWNSAIAISVRANSDDGIIVNNNIHDSANGIYFNIGSSNTNSCDGWLVTDNEIHNMDQECYYCNGDSHAIGVQGGSYNLFEYNHLHHLGGSGITFYTFPLQAQNNNTVRYNYVHDVEDTGGGGRNQRGIEHGSSNRDDPEITLNNLVHHNVLSNIKGYALRVKSLKPAAGYTWSFFNNTVYNAGTGFTWGEYSNPINDAIDGIDRNPGFRFQNNLLIDPAVEHIFDGFDAKKNHYGIEMANNIYYPDGAYFRRRDEIHPNYHDWQAVFAGTDTGTSTDDPLLANRATGDLHLTSNSPAIDAGVNTGFTEDFDGSRILSVADIGAKEFGARAKSEQTVTGTVEGDMTDVVLTDDGYEVISEVINHGGGRLNQKWLFDITGNSVVQLAIEAHHTKNEEGDDFIIAYSIDDLNYTDVLTVTKVVDDGLLQTATITGLSGSTLYIMAKDASRSRKKKDMDSLSATDQDSRGKKKGKEDKEGKEDSLFVDQLYLGAL